MEMEKEKEKEKKKEEEPYLAHEGIDERPLPETQRPDSIEVRAMDEEGIDGAALSIVHGHHGEQRRRIPCLHDTQ